MSSASRRLAGPAVLGVSAAALSQLLPGVAAAAPAGARAQLSGAQAHQGQHAAAGSATTAAALPDADSTGCTESSSPDYGCGKVIVDAQPVPGTFPATATPDLSGLSFDILGEIAENNTPYDNAESVCVTGNTSASPPATDPDACPESLQGTAPDPANSGSFVTGTWIAKDPYMIELDTSDSSKPAPEDAIIPAVTGRFPDCTAEQFTGSSAPTAPSGCADTVPVPVYGKYHRIGLHIFNKVTHKGAAGVTYKLCSPTAGAPQLTGTTCPSGSSLLTQATTDAHGKLVFTDVYAGSPNYTVVPARGLHGYRRAHIEQLDVPAVTTIAQSGRLIEGAIGLTPIRTIAGTHRVSTTAGKKVSISAFAGARHVVKRLKLIKLGKAHHGTVRHAGATITYKPAAGFTGKDVFRYTIRNGVGLRSTGKIVVTVKP